MEVKRFIKNQLKEGQTIIFFGRRRIYG